MKRRRGLEEEGGKGKEMRQGERKQWRAFGEEKKIGE